MLNFEYSEKLNVGRVCFEVSLKPFGNDTDAEAVCRKLFTQWSDLLHYASGCSVLLWTSDGSEILEYTGDIEQTFDWSRYLGLANPPERLPEWDPEGKDIHNRPKLFREDTKPISYRRLREIVRAIKSVGKKVTGLDIEVGETFDPGPEFAVSDFKFVRHGEIGRANNMVDMNWVYCASQLHSDDSHYAAFPDGIAEGTHFGYFLGKQFLALKKDIGFDYLWLSNGFGFSLNSWSWRGEVFDGVKFNPSASSEVRRAINRFWKELTDAVGDTRIETRGSNLTTAMDCASHGTPLADIYKVKNIVAPPNSPWAAIDRRFGLELSGYMTHISELPEKGYLFRYYIHDPWWHNSPWFDRYQSAPYDIYLPLSIARLDEKASPVSPAGISFLSADDSFGNMPLRCPIEVTPHLLEAYDSAPDAPGPVVWVYPFDTYCKAVRPDKIFMDDWLIERAIDNGFPLNSVVSDKSIALSGFDAYGDSILVMPVPEKGSVLERVFLDAADKNIGIIVYGNEFDASDEVKTVIGIRSFDGISGVLTVKTSSIDCSGQHTNCLKHNALVSNGEITSVASDCERVIALVFDNKKERAYCVRNKNVCWMRGSFPYELSDTPLPQPFDRNECYDSSELFRVCLAELGIYVSFKNDDPTAKMPLITAARNDNSLYFSSYSDDTTIPIRLGYPLGAPLLSGKTCFVSDSVAEYLFPEWIHTRCRFYVKQQGKSKISTMRVTAEDPSLSERFRISGLLNATVSVTPPRVKTPRFVLNNSVLLADENVSVKSGNGVYTTEPVTGTLWVSW